MVNNPFLVRLGFISLEMMLYGLCVIYSVRAKEMEMKRWRSLFQFSALFLFVSWLFSCWELYYTHITTGVRV